MRALVTGGSAGLGRALCDQLILHLTKGEGFDVVIFNAGISATGKFQDIEVESHARVIAVNSEAPMVLCAGLMARGTINHGGHIGFISSLSYFTGYPGAASYAASKDAIATYAKSIEKPFAQKGVSVTTIFPGPLNTDHAARHAPEGAKADSRMMPEQAASLILADILAGKKQSLPGFAAKLFAKFGRIAPTTMTWAMRRIIFEKLDKTVGD